MIRARGLLERLPVSGRVLRTIDALRQERDGLRAQRDRLQDQLVRQEEAAGLAAVTSGRPPKVLLAPSFLAHTERLRRIRGVSREMNGHADAVWEYNSKPAGVALARELGLRVPEQLSPPRPLHVVMPPTGQPCVIKPTSGAASRGVSPLVPAAGGRWLNLFEQDRGPQSWEAIRESLERLVRDGSTASEFLIEELLPGHEAAHLPYDWKLLCIGGAVVLTFVRDSGGKRFNRDSRYRWFDRDWHDLGPIRNPDQVDPSLPEPQHPAELVRVAEQIARVLPSVFVRIDLFDTPDGVVFGEITPQPGTPLWFGADLDRRLGEMWDRAEARTWARTDRPSSKPSSSEDASETEANTP